MNERLAVDQQIIYAATPVICLQLVVWPALHWIMVTTLIDLIHPIWIRREIAAIVVAKNDIKVPAIYKKWRTGDEMITKKINTH